MVLFTHVNRNNQESVAPWKENTEIELFALYGPVPFFYLPGPELRVWFENQNNNTSEREMSNTND